MSKENILIKCIAKVTNIHSLSQNLNADVGDLCELTIHELGFSLYNKNKNATVQQYTSKTLFSVKLELSETIVKKLFTKLTVYNLNMNFFDNGESHYLPTLSIDKGSYELIKLNWEIWKKESIDKSHKWDMDHIAETIAAKLDKCMPRPEIEPIEKTRLRCPRLEDISFETKEIMLTLGEQVQFLENEIIEIKSLSRYFSSSWIDVVTLLRTPELESLTSFSASRNIKKSVANFESVLITISEILKSYEKELGQLLIGVKAGVDGEDRLHEELMPFRDTMIVLDGIRLKIAGTTIETDAIIINEKGLFSVEVKNYGESGVGRIAISNDGKWTRYNNAGKEIPITDPMHQVNRHIAFGQQLINNELKSLYPGDMEYVYMQPLIVIGNDNIQIENNSDNHIVRVSNVSTHILNYKSERKLSPKLQQEIKDILEKADKGSKPYPLTVYSEAIKLAIPKLERNHKLLSDYVNLAKTTDWEGFSWY